MTIIEKLLSIARGEIGYVEKANATWLDDKNKNPGKNNYTKYGRDLKALTDSGDTYGVNYQWCDQFVDWCFVSCFGVEQAKKMLGGWSAYTPASAELYKKEGRWRPAGSTPAPGDQIFFKNSVRIHHTGIVEKVKNGIVYTIEGNTAAGSTVESDGGEVAAKSYKIGDSHIAGYGIPLWSVAENIEDLAAIGWHEDESGKWYRHTKGYGESTYYHSGIFSIDGKVYCFNESGYLVKNNKKLIHLNSETGEIYFGR